MTNGYYSYVIYRLTKFANFPISLISAVTLPSCIREKHYLGVRAGAGRSESEVFRILRTGRYAPVATHVIKF